MLPDSPSSASDPSPAEPVYRLYSALSTTLPLDSQAGLGGKLLYAGDIERGRNLLYAANIAGAASLAASADPTALRQAMRDGVVDFLVTSLEEALRILKNEIRKRQTVSVGVSADPYRVAEQMLERGVLPDLLPFDGTLDPAHAARFLGQGSRPILAPADSEAEFVSWSVDRDFARWLPRLDACALSILPPEDFIRKRWLRLAPRYLGRLAHRQHGVALTEAELMRFRAEVEQALAVSRSEDPPDVAIQAADSPR